MKIWVLVSLCAVALAKHEKYAGWKSYYVAPTTPEQLEVFGYLETVLEVDILGRPRLDNEGVVLVKPEFQEEFNLVMTKQNIKYWPHVEDVKLQLDIEDEAIEARHAEFHRTGIREKPYDNYLPVKDIDDFVDEIAANHPDVVTLVTAGKSFEGRPIRYLKISSSNFEDKSKPIIFIESTIHAREWIAPPVATYAIHKLTENRTDADILEKFDWIVYPVSNPDGYEYTHTNERFWRKTRSTDNAPTSVRCPGVDGNRNYDIHWMVAGTSTNPCTEIYGGSKAFSEIETRLVRDVIHEHVDRIKLFLTMHSFGSMILYPWGHDGSLSPNALGLHTVGISMAEAIDRVKLPNFPKYMVGNSKLVIGYGASGAAEDYAHSLGVPLAYTYELPGLRQGFDLDPKYARQVAEETWEGIVAGAWKAREITKR